MDLITSKQLLGQTDRLLIQYECDLMIVYSLIIITKIEMIVFVL